MPLYQESRQHGVFGIMEIGSWLGLGLGSFQPNMLLTQPSPGLNVSSVTIHGHATVLTGVAMEMCVMCKKGSKCNIHLPTTIDCRDEDRFDVHPEEPLVLKDATLHVVHADHTIEASDDANQYQGAPALCIASLLTLFTLLLYRKKRLTLHSDSAPRVTVASDRTQTEIPTQRLGRQHDKVPGQTHASHSQSSSKNTKMRATLAALQADKAELSQKLEALRMSNSSVTRECQLLAEKYDALATRYASEKNRRFWGAKVIQQVHFYFSSENLSTDFFLQQLMDQHSGFVAIDELLKFPRMRALGVRAEDIQFLFAEAGEDAIVELDNSKTQLRSLRWWNRRPLA